MTHDLNLKRIYFTLLLPAVAGFIAIFLMQHFHLVDWNIPNIPRAIHPFVFIISVCFAVAFPILYRTVFANKMRHQTHTAEEDWLKFERNLLYIAMATPYVCLIAQILKLPRFHLGGTIIMALYAVYYFYPSKKRIDYERRIFRVKG
jgi:MFS family permease